MSSGYTPLFSSLLDGTLYGKWPVNGIWGLLLSQCDKHGIIDMVPKLLAAKIGISEKKLMQCIEQLMAPDPGSRTGDLEGRRMELIDPDNRNWGWRIVNHGIYREKGRKAAYSTDTDTNSNTDTEGERAKGNGTARAARSPSPTRLPVDFELTPERRACAEAIGLDATKTFERFSDHWKSSPGSKGLKQDWEATWRNWCRTESSSERPGTKKTVQRLTADEIEAHQNQKVWDHKHRHPSATLAELVAATEVEEGDVERALRMMRQ